MRITINDNGGYLRREGQTFVYTSQEEKKRVAASLVQQFIISPRTNVSADALRLASENMVDIIFADDRKAYARLALMSYDGAAKTKRAQYSYSYPLAISQQLVSAKLRHQKALIRLIRERDGENQLIVQARETIDTSLKQIKAATVSSEIFGFEGIAAKAYWEAYFYALPGDVRPQGRAHRPANDPINAALNYAYAVLASDTQRSLTIAGLDPYYGFLHTDRAGKPSLTLDVMEMFRPLIVDITVLALARRKQLSRSPSSDSTIETEKKTDSEVETEPVSLLAKNFLEEEMPTPKEASFDTINRRQLQANVYRLPEAERHALINQYNTKQDTHYAYKGKKYRASAILQYTCHDIARILRSEQEPQPKDLWKWMP